MLPDAWRPSQIERISDGRALDLNADGSGDIFARIPSNPSITYAAGGDHVDRRAGLDIEAMLPDAWRPS